jgi:HK97 family phage major capsid protein
VSKQNETVETVELDEEAAHTIADLVVEKIQRNRPDGSLAAKASTIPNRTNLGDVPTNGIVPKAGETAAKYYGGLEAKYMVLGTTDTDIAVGAWLTKTIISATNPKTGRPYAETSLGMPIDTTRLDEVMVNAATKAIGGQPAEIPDYAPNGYGGLKAVDVDRFVSNSYRMMRESARTKAMVSTTANAGDEWVPTFATSELWREVHTATAVSASITRVAMPTNPYTLPTLDADMTFYYVSTENVAPTESDPNTGNATLTARKVAAFTEFSGETTEDSIVPLVPSLRATMVRRAAQCIDDLIVSGDTETAGTGNVNSDDQAPAAGAFYTALNGMRKFCLVTNTAQVSNVAAAITTTNFTTIRALLGKYGARGSDCRIVVPTETLIAMSDIASVRTIDVYGPNATLVQGELARFYNMPVLLSESIPSLTNGKTAADGKADAATPSNNTVGWILVYNVNGWRQGFRRELTVEADRNISTDTNTLVTSFRMALVPSGIATTHSAVGRNVTV